MAQLRHAFDAPRRDAKARSSASGRSERRSRRERAEAEQSLRLARHTLKVSQRRLADRLRLLYEQGAADPMSVLVGATSVDDAINRIDNLHRIAGLDREVIDAAKAARAHLTVVTQRLAADEARGAGDRGCNGRHGRRARGGSAGAGRHPRLAARQAKRELVADLHARVAGPRARGHAQRRAERPHADACSRPATRSTGHTSTGVPVGYGIVAVDPSVIALGTKMAIPGYGEGVAADTGGAVSGAHIDLWFPTEAEALAWGSRTVTVTLH